MNTGRVAQAARLCLSDAGRISVYQITELRRATSVVILQPQVRYQLLAS